MFSLTRRDARSKAHIEAQKQDVPIAFRADGASSEDCKLEEGDRSVELNMVAEL